MPRGETIAGIDIGTSKTLAVIAASGPDGLEILGFGEAQSNGMRKGVVTDLDETARGIELAVERAERMAGVPMSHVYVAITGDHVSSQNNRAVVAVSGDGREVVEADVRRVLEASKIINLAADREIIHAIPIQFTVDGQDGVSDPVGMSGGRLEVDTHIVTGGSSFLNNVLKCVERAGLTAIGTVFQPIAVGAAALLQEEKDVGCVLLDLGGGTLDIAVYAHGSVVHTATLPIGGNVLTNDIAHGLKTTFAEADHIKRTYGSGLLRADEPEQTFHVKTLDGRSTREVTSTQLRAIVGPRVLELFRLAKANVLEHLNRDQAVSEVVLTGGGARLRGIELTAAEIFGLPVRIGVPATVAGLTEALKQPEYAAGVGLLLAGPQGDTTPHLAPKGAGALSKLWSWFASIWN